MAKGFILSSASQPAHPPTDFYLSSAQSKAPLVVDDVGTIISAESTIAVVGGVTVDLASPEYAAWWAEHYGDASGWL